MTQDNSKLNGSVDRLAEALRDVFTEAVQGAVEPVATEVKALRTEVRDIRTEVKDMEQRLTQSIDDNNKRIEESRKEMTRDLHSQIAQQGDVIAEIVNKKMKRTPATRAPAKPSSSP